MAKKRRAVNIFEDYDPLWRFIRGEGKWVNIVQPDDYGNWSINLYGDEALELETELQAYLDEAVEFAKEKGKDVQVVADLYSKDQEGNKYLKLKKKQYDEDTPRPKIYNVTGEEVTDEWTEPIGGGSKLRVKVMFKPYYMGSTKSIGLSKKLIAVQIIENKKFAGGGGGFQDESSGENPPFETEDYQK